MVKRSEKTNVMRILDAKGIKYNSYNYDKTLFNAVDVANALGKNAASLFKTLVTIGKTGGHYVFMVPGEQALDLKKAASAAKEKSLEMLPQKELLPLTGYVHGGCSPIGMKKQFETFIDSTAENFDTICFSAGSIGYQVELSLSDLKKIVNVGSADITKDV